PTPVRVEIFPSHADFSVRTLGEAGLGALGVSFGSTLVMDSPSAREPGDFNWESTLWHELAHAFHLAMTDHRVPRWFSEGLAVHEQRTADERWGPPLSPGWLQAYQAGRLHPVSRLNEGFVRPDYPEQVLYSYYEASLVFDMIEERQGFDAVLAMLRGYRDGRTTGEVVREVLGMDLDHLDDAFDDYVEERFGDRMAAVAPLTDGPPTGAPSLEALRQQARRHPGSFQARLALGKALYKEGDREEAEGELQAAQDLFPEYGAGDSPWLYLARIHRDQGELETAAGELNALGRRNEGLLQVHLEEAGIRTQLGQSEAAARALEKAVEVFPYDVETHVRLAELYGELGDPPGAVRERRAVLALDPVDVADAHYRLADALLRGGDREGARREVLRSLEIAPNFQAALDLLLEIRGGAR
ncbi:MAG TPA: tetratricopeptide repeat protein, partial [Longimicrobiales bacterium]|nr:tetratricopeptide repeat protein [Longimicrobiales bacterium]